MENITLTSLKRLTILPGILILFCSLEVSILGCSTYKQYKQDAEKLCSPAAIHGIPEVQPDEGKGRIYPLPGEIITTDHFTGLPEIVQRYLNETGVTGQKMVSTVQLRQTGKIRTAPGSPWMKVKAVETYNIELSEFLWYADVKMNPIIRLTGYDRFQDGHGSMKIKMFDLFSVVDASGPSIDQGGMMRYLNELMWLPMGYLHPSVSWGYSDEKSVEVSITINETTVSGIIDFNNDALPINFTAKRYMDGEKGKPTLETWMVPIDSWREYHGVILPEHGFASWLLKDGEFQYIELTIEDVEFGADEIWRP